MDFHNVIEFKCACGKIIRTIGGTPGVRGPKPGDFSVCVKCGGINRFDDSLMLRTATQEEIGTLPTSVQLQVIELQERVREINRLEIAKN